MPVTITIEAEDAARVREEMHRLLGVQAFEFNMKVPLVDDGEPTEPEFEHDAGPAPEPTLAETLQNTEGDVQDEREKLLAEAKELGIKYIRASTPTDKLRDKVAEARAEARGEQPIPSAPEPAAAPAGAKPDADGPTLDDVRAATTPLVLAGAEASQKISVILKELGAVNEHGHPKASSLDPAKYEEAIQRFNEEVAKLSSSSSDGVEV